MKTIHFYLSTLIGTLSDPRFYHHVLSRSRKEAIIFLITTVIGLTLFQTALVSYQQLYPFLKNAESVLQDLKTLYPPNLDFTFTPDRFEFSGEADQVKIPVTDSVRTLLNRTILPETLVYFSRTEVATPSLALITLTPSQFSIQTELYRSESRSWNTLEITETATISSQQVTSGIVDLINFNNRYQLFYPIVVFLLLIPINCISALLLSWLLSSLVRIIGVFLGLRISQKQSHKLSIHGYIFAVVVSTLLNLVIPQYTGIGFLLFAFFAAIVLVLIQLPKNK